MKKTNYFEIIGVLSVSLLLTATFSVSGCLPEMIKGLEGYSRASVETLVSIPCTAMMIIIALTPFISRYLSTRTMIIIGLLLTGAAGIVPVFFPTYQVMIVSRFILGLGNGLTNTSAVTLIGERFSGNLRIRLQGIRCSMETLGQSATALLAGQLLMYGWNYSFLIYGIAFPILVLFLITVSGKKKVFEEDEPVCSGTYKFTSKDWSLIMQNALLAVFVVSSIAVNNLRVSSYVIEKNVGTAVDGSNIISVSVFIGFLGGLVFGKLYQILKQNLLPLSLLLSAAGLAIVVFGNNLFLMTVGAAFLSCFTTILLSHIFNMLSDNLPRQALNTANSITLVGCNLGSTITPFVLNTINKVFPSLSAGYLTYAAIYVLLAVIFFLSQRKKEA